MRFVKTDDLKVGMRIARPIYNRNGVMLYERDSRLTEQGISSIRNFQLIGIYVLDTAEPVPPMTEFDIEFERFQTMSVFSLKDDLKVVLEKHNSRNLYRLANMILEGYGSVHEKVQFLQNLRSKQDYVYKHTLNVAILCALISGAMGLSQNDKLDAIMAGLLHDAGLLLLPNELLYKMDGYTDKEEEMIMKCREEAYNGFLVDYDLNPNSRIAIAQYMKLEQGNPFTNAVSTITRILYVADFYDTVTAMKMDEEPVSPVKAVQQLKEKQEEIGTDVVEGLLQALQILSPSVCVELTTGEKGLVLAENPQDIMRPIVLGFDNNTVYNLADDAIYKQIQVKDIMKTMDNRYVMDRSLLEKYKGVLTAKRWEA